MQEITLILTGDPMPKQSVQKGKNGFYQPAKFATREKDYRRQIKKQLPPDFVVFDKWVQVVSLDYITQPTKAQLNHRKMSAWLEFGGLIPRPFKPDLMDNISKLLFDSLQKKPKLKSISRIEYARHYSTHVMRDDSMVYLSKMVGKWYGLNPSIELKLIGE